MGIVVYSLLWVMQDLYHQPYFESLGPAPEWLKRWELGFDTSNLDHKGII